MTGRAIRHVGVAELRSAVRFEELIEPVASALRQSSAGQAQNGFISLFPGKASEDGDVYIKAGAGAGRPIFLVKVSPWFAANVEAGTPQGGLIAVFDSANGHALALLEDEHFLSDIRTAAAGAVAARMLAPTTVRTALVAGAGIQARWQALALHSQRKFDRLLLWGRGQAKAEALAERLRLSLPGVSVEAVPDLQRAVAEADAIITATLAREPIIRGSWLRAGQHITALGADDHTKCELDADALRRARVFVDDRASAIVNGDIARAIGAGLYAPDEIAGELGDLVAAKLVGRRDEQDITVAKLVGLGIQDLATAEVVLKKLGIMAGAGGTQRLVDEARAICRPPGMSG